LELTCTCFEQSLVEFYTVHLEDLQVALRILEVGVWPSL
jgi:hypothetical protein